MSELDYNKLGLKCGLEIHQQLDSSKLFCNCLSVLRSDSPDYELERKLHVVAGESGEIDKAAKHEAEKDKSFTYQGYDSVCLIEMDEEPPHEINLEALKTALHVAILLNCKIIPLTQIMRKTVIDGSNTSGFQRTVLIAHSGYVETEKGKVGIESVCLEEDAARIVEKKKDKTIFRLDRLGIPLVEIATAPDIKTPEQAKEVALHIGNILRSCKVKRGLGTIRQDVNLSIKEGERIELKGFQDIKNVERAIEKEVERQIELVKKNQSVPEVRNVLSDGKSEFLRPMPGAARMYPETDLPLLKIHRDFINEAKRTLPKLRTEVEEELKKKGLKEDMIKLLFKEEKVSEFTLLYDILKNPSLIAKMLLIFPKEIASRKKISLESVEEKVSDNFERILNLIKEKKLKENNIQDVLNNLVEGKSFEDSVEFEEADSSEIEERIMNLIKEKPGLNQNAYMGVIMKDASLKGKVDGKEVMEIIRRLLG